MTNADWRSNPDNFCYRHPKRQSFVLCRRCGRTICGECQVQTPVGVICPDDAGTAKRTPFGRPSQRRRGSAQRSAVMSRIIGPGSPAITNILVIAITVVSLIGMLFPAVNAALSYGARYSLVLPGYFQPWRILTMNFVHGGILHLLINMFSFWVLGSQLERIMGRGRYSLVLLSSTAGAALAVALLQPQMVTVGASGVIFGMFGAMVPYAIKARANLTGFLVIVGINLVWGFLVPGVAWQAHVGGMIFGAAVSAMLLLMPKKKVAMGLAIGVTVLAAVLTIPAAMIAFGV